MELSSRGILLTMSVGLLTTSLGMLFMIFRPCEIIVAMRSKFFEGGYIFELWRKPPVEVYLKVYIFNITNKEAFLNGTEKLKVDEVGPYIFREFSEHANTEFNDNGTVTGAPKQPLQFVPEMSAGTEEVVFLLPNVALLSLANVAIEMSTITKFGFNMLIGRTNSPPIIEQTAKEFMFNYESPLVTLGNTFMSSWISFDKIGLVDRMYDLEGDVFTAYTGETDPHLTGTFATYNRLPYLPQWPSAPCNKLDGSSDGTKFQSKIEPNETLWFFRKSMGRAIPMVQTSAFITAEGIDVVHYKFRDDAFHYGKGNEENRCFCTNDKCLRNGLLDVSMWYYGFPIALSYPHFYMADHTIREETKGMNPEADLHESRFILNPQTGTPLKASVKIQANLMLGDIQEFLNCERFSNLVVPLMWVDIDVPKLSFSVKFVLFMLTRVAPLAETITSYLLLICGGSFIVISFRALINSMREKGKMRKRSQKQKEYLDHKEHEDYVKKYGHESEKKLQRNSNSGESEMCFSPLLLTSTFDRDDVKVPLTPSTTAV